MSQKPDSNTITRDSGFTLVELMVVITVVAILMMVGIPSYKYVTVSSRVSGEINSLLADAELARSEAVKEGSTVTICASTDGSTCSTTTTDWSKGWIVFSDVNGDGAFTSGADALIKVGPAFTSTDVISSAGATAISSMTFNREGFANLPSSDQADNTGITLKLNVTPTNQRWERCLNVTWVGAMVTQRGGDANTSCK